MAEKVKISLSAEGASGARSAIGSVTEELGRLGQKGGAAGTVLKEIGKIAFRIASDVAHAFNDVRPIDFGASANKARSFADEVARYSQRASADGNLISSRFRAIGESVGVSSDRVAHFGRALQDATLAGDVSGSLKDLGEYANDTGRELEQVGDIGATLYTKLGTPIEKIGSELQHLRDLAKDFETVGGTLALERSLIRTAPLLAKIGGTTERKMAFLAEVGRGKSPEVAEETASGILGAIAGMDQIRVQRKLAQLTGDPKIRALTPGPGGRLQLNWEALEVLQKHWKQIPREAVYNLFGRSTEGVYAAEEFLKVDLGRVRKNAREREDFERRVSGGEVRGVPLEGLLPSQMERIRREGFGEFYKGPRLGDYERRRRSQAQANVERGNVELRVGDWVQEQRDKRSAAYEGRRGTQAAIDTIKSSLPETVQRVADLAEAAGVEAQSNQGARRSPGPSAVELTERSIDRLANTLAKRPVVAQPEKSTSATAVEDSKAVGRSQANY